MITVFLQGMRMARESYNKLIKCRKSSPNCDWPVREDYLMRIPSKQICFSLSSQFWILGTIKPLLVMDTAASFTGKEGGWIGWVELNRLLIEYDDCVYTWMFPRSLKPKMRGGKTTMEPITMQISSFNCSHITVQPQMTFWWFVHLVEVIS